MPHPSPRSPAAILLLTLAAVLPLTLASGQKPPENPPAEPAPAQAEAKTEAEAPKDASEETERLVALTFDDLPANSTRNDVETHRAITRGLVEVLSERTIPAIGFVNERKVMQDGEPDPRRVALLEDWLEAGLELGNHTFSHPDLHDTDIAEYEADVLRGERITRPMTAEHGRPLRYFRHPFLHTGTSLEVKQRLEKFLEERGYRVAPVTLDNAEWIFARAYDHALDDGDEALAGRIATAYVPYMGKVFAYYEQQSRALFDREIPQVLLLHANRLNAAVLPDLLAMITGRGYDFASLDEVLEDPAYASADTYTGPGGITWLHRWALTAGKKGEFFAGEPEAPAFVQRAYRRE